MQATGSLLAGRYRICVRSGRAAWRPSSSAEDERLGREVAVKRLHAHSPPGGRAALRARGQARRVAEPPQPRLRLRHRHRRRGRAHRDGVRGRPDAARGAARRPARPRSARGRSSATSPPPSTTRTAGRRSPRHQAGQRAAARRRRDEARGPRHRHRRRPDPHHPQRHRARHGRVHGAGAAGGRRAPARPPTSTHWPRWPTRRWRAAGPAAGAPPWRSPTRSPPSRRRTSARSGPEPPAAAMWPCSAAWPATRPSGPARRASSPTSSRAPWRPTTATATDAAPAAVHPCPAPPPRQRQAALVAAGDAGRERPRRRAPSGAAAAPHGGGVPPGWRRRRSAPRWPRSWRRPRQLAFR